MAGRIFVFGATGYTGRLVVEALTGAGEKPVLAGRTERSLRELADEVGASDTLVADAEQPDGSLTAALEPGDVLVTTVGPFLRVGEPAVTAAVETGAHYIDSTGEAAFIRRVFAEHGPRAAGRCGLLTAMGYDFLPGNLAGALAIRDAGADQVARVDVGYFGLGAGALSSGTMASTIGIVSTPAHSWRDGAIVEERVGQHVRSFAVNGRQMDALSLGGTEAYGLPREAPDVQAVTTYVGWLGKYTRAAASVAAVQSAVGQLPGAGRIVAALTDLAARRTGRGPGADERTGRSRIVAVASAADGEPLATVQLDGPDGYELTGALMAWGARVAAAGDLRGSGALAPVEAFGLDELEAGAASCGLERVS